MASSEGDGHITLDKFGGDNFNLYKFKLEMVLSTKNLWEIVEGTELPPPSTASDKVKKAYERRYKKDFAIIVTSLVDKQLAHIKGVKDRRNRGRPCATSTRPKACPTSYSQGASSSPSKWTKAPTSSTTSTR